MKIKIIKILLSSASAAILFSATTMVVDSNSLAESQLTSPRPFLEATSTASDGNTECMTIDDSTASAWNAGELCLAPDSRTSTTGISVAIDPEFAGFRISQDIFEASSALGEQCVSAGGSSATNENDGGFCLASDISTSETDFANFSVDNALPVTGMQFLQATFGDGSTQSASATIGAECQSIPGSTSAIVNDGGFCLASDLTRSITDFARFSVGNGLPVVSLQFLQVKFAISNSFGGAPLAGRDTECVSIGGSTASIGTSAGFCLASDLSTSTEEFADFSVAHAAPATDLHFLQVTFATNNLPGGPLPPSGAECLSKDGSIAAIGNPDEFCLLSDLIGSSTGSARIAVANDLPISGLQLLQATFGDGGSLPSQGLGAECVSADGSTATTGNAEGFCLASDRGTLTTGFANLSVANDLPIATLHFLQVPFRDDSQLNSLRYKLGEGAPMGAVIFDPPARILQPPLPGIVGIASHKNQYFRITQRRSGVKIQSGGNPLAEFWLSL